MQALQLFMFAAVGALLYILFNQHQNEMFTNTLITSDDGYEYNFQDRVKEQIGAQPGAENCPSQFPKHTTRTGFQLTGAPMPLIKDSPLGEFILSEADLWAQANPNGTGAFKDRNFLDAGYMSNGIDTVGQNRKTMNMQFRSDPSVPQYSRSVWRPDMFSPVDIETRVMSEGAAATC